MAFDRTDPQKSPSLPSHASEGHHRLRERLNRYFDGTWQVNAAGAIESAPLEPAYAASVAATMNALLEKSAAASHVTAAPCARMEGFSRVQMDMPTADTLLDAAQAQETAQQGSFVHRLRKGFRAAMSYSPATTLDSEGPPPGKPSGWNR